jgi:WXXGXW repeat (2 copies)
MKFKLAVLLAALLCAGAVVPATSQAIGFSIYVGDRPYYTHGPWYWNNGERLYWTPGYWAWRHHHRVWIPGHYSRRPYRHYRYY